MTKPWLVLLACLACGLAARPAQAQSCSITTSGLTFVVDPFSGNIDANGTVSASCTGLGLLRQLRVCLNIGAGSGGSGTSLSPRYLVSGSNRLNFNVFRDSSRSNVWGSALVSGTTPRTLDLPSPILGSTSGSATMYGRVFGSQGTAAIPGTYLSSFAGAEVSAWWYYWPLVGSPAPCTTVRTTQATFAFQARATIASNCLIAADDLDFGTVGVLRAATDAQSQMRVTCTSTTPYTVALNAGTGSGATVANRKMTRSGGGTVAYQLYTNAGRTIPWGDGTLGTARATGTGTGNQQSLTVYGRVPAQTTPSAGTYLDTIIATITY